MLEISKKRRSGECTERRGGHMLYGISTLCMLPLSELRRSELRCSPQFQQISTPGPSVLEPSIWLYKHHTSHLPAGIESGARMTSGRNVYPYTYRRAKYMTGKKYNGCNCIVKYYPQSLEEKTEVEVCNAFKYVGSQ
jgi:hypothetical protein